MQQWLQKTKIELRIRNYSLKTVSAYLACLKEYFTYKNSDLDKSDQENLRNFLLKKQDSGYSPQTVNLYLNAIKFFYREIIRSSEPINIKFAKRNKFPAHRFEPSGDSIIIGGNQQ